MAKSVDQQIKDAMAKKVVGQTTEIYKAIVVKGGACASAADADRTARPATG
jgi:hypothetical protein